MERKEGNTLHKRVTKTDKKRNDQLYQKLEQLKKILDDIKLKYHTNDSEREIISNSMQNVRKYYKQRSQKSKI
jgi:hypothetical protein